MREWLINVLWTIGYLGLAMAVAILLSGIAHGADQPTSLKTNDRLKVLELYNDLRISTARFEEAKKVMAQSQQDFAATLVKLNELIEKLRPEYKADGYTLDDHAAWVPNSPKRE